MAKSANKRDVPTVVDEFNDTIETGLINYLTSRLDEVRFQLGEAENDHPAVAARVRRYLEDRYPFFSNA